MRSTSWPTYADILSIELQVFRKRLLNLRPEGASFTNELWALEAEKN